MGEIDTTTAGSCNQVTTNYVNKNLLPSGTVVAFCESWRKADGLWKSGHYKEAQAITEGVYKAAKSRGKEGELPAEFLDLHFNYPSYILESVLYQGNFPQALKAMVQECGNEADVKLLAHNLKPLFINFMALIRSESNFNPNLVSSKGAVGLGQLMPRTARELAKKLGIEAKNLMDIWTNLRLSFAFYVEQVDRFGVYATQSLDLLDIVVSAYKFGQESIYQLWAGPTAKKGCNYSRNCFYASKPKVLAYIRKVDAYARGMNEAHGKEVEAAINRVLQRIYIAKR